MNTSEQNQLVVLDSLAERAARLAPAMTFRDVEWTVQDVINVALNHGLGEFEKQYLNKG